MAGTISVKDVVWSSWCEKVTRALPSYPVQSTDVLPYVDKSSAAPLRKGDHHMDLPYAASWTEVIQPFEGEYRTHSWMDAESQCPGQRNRFSEHEGSVSYLSLFTDISALTGRWPELTLRDKQPDLVRFLRESAVTAALADARSGIMNLPLIYADRVGTVRLVQDKLRQLANLCTTRGRADIRRFFRTDPRSRRRIYRQIASEHLGFLFGVLPLVAEIEGLIEILEKGFPDKIITGRGKRTDSDSDVPPPLYYAGSNNGQVNAILAFRRQMRLKVVVSLKYKVTTESVVKSQKLGFNAAAVGYDLIPLSFLSDFISNTGNFLRAYDPIVGAEFSTGCWTVRRDTTLEGFAYPGNRNDAPNLVRKVMSGTGKLAVKSGDMERFVFSEEPEPIWHFQNNMSLSRAATLASLAVQRYLKPLRRVVAEKPFRYKGPRPKFLPPIKYR